MSITAVTSPKDTLFRVFFDLPIAISYNFIEFPSCGLAYSISPLQSFVNINTRTKTITVFSSDPKVRGEYLTILTANPMTFGVTYSYTFKIIMFDICKAASFLKPNTLPNIEVYMQNLDGLKVDQPIIYQYDVL